ncbi:anti-FecI sigma factor, FecR [Methyloglobulus morosus KoM1]|uniref:Anti-FecI sigma factor, FecR n=1 Tax=Methyloglobulus morosus KoM1 TaxID=1116472 RepID=V5C0C5_9GAMM|nr:FecR family protein [Methyloglobulus morosus]ESS71952.1 anti-FecI sigma factor, FecR [Methyloglobulus morosus KoM1]
MKKLITANRDRLEQEAVDWLARLTSGEAVADDFVECANWRNRSHAHNQAYQKINTLWDQLDAPLLVWHEQTLSGTEEPALNQGNQATQSAPKRRLSKVWPKRFLAAAIVAWVTFSWFPDYLSYPLADYRTLIGEQKTVRLEDGSILHLNTDTAINVHYSASARHIELLQGEAAFEVSHDDHKPFIVASGNIQTRAVGTQFIVRYDNHQGLITLLEGKVQVSNTNKAEDGHNAITLNPNEQVAYQDNRFTPLPHGYPDGADAWLNGRLQMNFVTFGQAIDEINRYRRVKVRLLAPQLAQRKINAVIDLKQIDAWLEALESTLPVAVRQVGPLVLISSTG